MRIKYFAQRNFTELRRDPLSYIFCLGFPIIMLFVMTIINNSIPKEANMTIFQIQSLGPAIIIFGLTFVMLFTCLTISNDRSSAFLVRLYASPMQGIDFLAGYTLPMIVIAIAQCVITLATSVVIGLFNNYTFNIGYLLLSIVFLLPTMVLFIAFGLLFGSLFNEKASPPLCSIIICACGMLGGIWMDLDTLGGGFAKVCKMFPFYHGVKVAREVAIGHIEDAMPSFLITFAYSIVVFITAVFVFRSKMQKDLK